MEPYSSGSCIIMIFTVVIHSGSISYVVADCHFCPSLIYEGEFGAYPRGVPYGTLQMVTIQGSFLGGN